MHTLDLLSFGSRIRKRREELLISKKELAEKLGITSKFMDDIESGTFISNSGNINRLSSFWKWFES